MVLGMSAVLSAGASVSSQAWVELNFFAIVLGLVLLNLLLRGE